MTGTGQAPMSYEAWVERFSPVFEDAEQSSLVQYPTWDSLPNGIDTHVVWAVIEGDADDCPHTEAEVDADECDCETPWVIMPGYHMVNVVYFALTRQPWSDADPIDYVLWD